MLAGEGHSESFPKNRDILRLGSHIFSSRYIQVLSIAHDVSPEIVNREVLLHMVYHQHQWVARISQGDLQISWPLLALSTCHQVIHGMSERWAPWCHGHGWSREGRRFQQRQGFAAGPAMGQELQETCRACSSRSAWRMEWRASFGNPQSGWQCLARLWQSMATYANFHLNWQETGG